MIYNNFIVFTKPREIKRCGCRLEKGIYWTSNDFFDPVIECPKCKATWKVFENIPQRGSFEEAYYKGLMWLLGFDYKLLRKSKK